MKIAATVRPSGEKQVNREHLLVNQVARGLAVRPTLEIDVAKKVVVKN